MQMTLNFELVFRLLALELLQSPFCPLNALLLSIYEIMDLHSLPHHNLTGILSCKQNGN